MEDTCRKSSHLFQMQHFFRSFIYFIFFAELILYNLSFCVATWHCSSNILPKCFFGHFSWPTMAYSRLRETCGDISWVNMSLSCVSIWFLAKTWTSLKTIIKSGVSRAVNSVTNFFLGHLLRVRTPFITIVVVHPVVSGKWWSGD